MHACGAFRLCSGKGGALCLLHTQCKHGEGLTLLASEENTVELAENSLSEMGRKSILLKIVLVGTEKISIESISSHYRKGEFNTFFKKKGRGLFSSVFEVESGRSGLFICLAPSEGLLLECSRMMGPNAD